MEDDEQISATGEGDEIMEEPEEQEDGYSTSISQYYTPSITPTPPASLSPPLLLLFTFIHRRLPWFCSLPGHEYFCEVTEEFIEDDFNLTGLNSMVPFWKEAMEMVLDVEPGVAPSSGSSSN
jgi:casein kinase II subunit beta